MSLELPEIRTWTREEYERMVAAGLLGPEERLELLEGMIVRRMGQGTGHAMGIGLVEEALREVFPQGHVVRVQLPLAMGSKSEPEPDIAVVQGNWRDFHANHPDAAVLVVEVSDESLRIDRTTKAAIYARAGIVDYWIVNLVDHLLEVCREPAALPEQPLGFHYRTIQRLTRADVISPLAAPAAVLRVADLLP